MFDKISMDSKNTNSSNNKNDDKPEEFIIDLINDENPNNLILNSDNIKNKKKSSKKGETYLNTKGIIPKKEEYRIICFSRRRKCPKHLEDLSCFLVTFFFFILFTVLITIGLSSAKKIPIISESQKTAYNWILFFIWLTSLISIIFLTDASTADPGRQRGTPISKTKFDKAKIKKIVGGQTYVLKYCTTCHLIRDIRTFHCKICGLCIEKHDHHCNYLSNCVGVYNYRKFLIFVICANIHISSILGTCIHFILFYQGEEYQGYEWIVFLICIIVIFAGFFEIFTIWMLLQNIINIIKNRTTREFIKKKEYGIYNKGCIENCKEALCSNWIKEY